MLRHFTGKLEYPKSLLNLNLTLLGGQSFRWTRNIIPTGTINTECFCGVFSNYFWKLNYLNDDFLKYEVFYTSETELIETSFENLLRLYLRLDFNLDEYVRIWKKRHIHFEETIRKFNAVRVLDQEVFENVISFICSQNNNISRITQMIEWLCRTYGKLICVHEKVSYYAFPTLESLNNDKNLANQLREAKFGYRAKMISTAVSQIVQKGGLQWLQSLRLKNYGTAKEELLAINGIGPKVADCICLMSLGHLESVPIDRHIFKIAQTHYDKSLSKIKLSRKYYIQVADMFRDIYGDYSGWAQAVLFCSMIDIK